MRPIEQQVVVITGASSGIGRETALMCGARGASVVLAARNEVALREVATEIARLGGKAEVAVTDVAEWPQVERLARTAINRFGRIDAWVNNAAVSTYATVEASTVEEIARVLQVDLLGQIHGMKAVLPHLVRQGEGTIINVASILAERGVPLQAAYCAAKHGVRGFTESLRLELARDHPGITVTLIEPSSINTPLFQHARSKLGVMPQPIPPIYQPRVVAEAILFALEHPRRTIVVGGAGKLLVQAEQLSRPLLDRFMLLQERGFTEQQTDQPDDGQDNLFAPMPGPGATTGEFGEGARSTSFYTRHLELHPNRKRVLNAAIVAGLIVLARRAGR